jgi:hypothetical protein
VADSFRGQAAVVLIFWVAQSFLLRLRLHLHLFPAKLRWVPWQLKRRAASDTFVSWQRPLRRYKSYLRDAYCHGMEFPRIRVPMVDERTVGHIAGETVEINLRQVETEYRQPTWLSVRLTSLIGCVCVCVWARAWARRILTVGNVRLLRDRYIETLSEFRSLTLRGLLIQVVLAVGVERHTSSRLPYLTYLSSLTHLTHLTYLNIPRLQVATIFRVSFPVSFTHSYVHPSVHTYQPTCTLHVFTPSYPSILHNYRHPRS